MSVNHTILKKIEKYNHIIWDWNGTLLNDLSVAIDSINVILFENNLPSLDEIRYREIFGFPIPKYYERAGFDFSKVPFEKLGERYVDEFNNKRAKNAKLFEGIIDVLAEVKKSKKQSILSAASQWHLDEIVAYYGIEKYFDYRFGIDNNFATSKLNRGRELVDIAQVPVSETILIGDTDHDLEVAQSLGMDCLLLSDGHQSHERLTALHDHVISGRR